jgi:hypothetical protein
MYSTRLNVLKEELKIIFAAETGAIKLDKAEADIEKARKEAERRGLVVESKVAGAAIEMIDRLRDELKESKTLSQEIAKLKQDVGRQENDYFLESMIRLANAGALDLTITLSVNGSIVTGELIGIKEYCEGLESEIRGANLVNKKTGEPADDIKLLSSIPVTLADSLPTTVEELYDLPVNYLHLRKARYFAGGALLPQNRGVYWRCKLDAVDGFCLGVVSSTMPQ